MQSSFHFIDWVIVATYLVAMALVGIYFSRKQTSLDQYLLAERNMGWLPVGFSLMAALNSGMDYLMQPSSTIRYGLVLVVRHHCRGSRSIRGSRRSCFRSTTVSISTPSTSISRRASTFASGRWRRLIFILWRVGWMATAMYVPSLAINAATGGQVDLNTMTIVVGVRRDALHDARRHPGA